MSGEKMETTKQALALFLQSLPIGSRFQIISFGTKHELMRSMLKGNAIMDYNDDNLRDAK